MLLISEGHKEEISHWYHLVSAYTPSSEMYEELRQCVREAILLAKEKTETQIVSMDNPRFCFHVHPSGAVSVMAQIAHFEKIEE